MKNLLILFLLTMQMGLAMAQSPVSFKKKVQNIPAAYQKPNYKTTESMESGKTDLPWIVFSDRQDNFTTTTPGGSLMMKKLGFMEPFYVSEEKDGYLKLIQYKAGMVRGRKINDRKSAISYGWIPKSKLLLWQRSYSDPATGYPEKAITLINGRQPLLESAFYYDGTDSVYVYDSPELKNKLCKIRLHEVAYVFKKSPDGKKYLVGNEDQLFADSARKSIYGWLGADAIHGWGNRLYVSPVSLSSFEQDDSLATALGLKSSDPLLGSGDILLRSYPVLQTDKMGKQVLGVANNVYDKSNNRVITISGSDLAYKEYLNLRKNIHKVNVVFVLDGGSAMTKNFPSLTNTIQSFEKLFQEHKKENMINYGAVVYRGEQSCNAAGVFSTKNVMNDYRQLMTFIGGQAKNTENCEYQKSAQPVFEGLTEATRMLRPHRNQTNLIVLIGSTGNWDNSSAAATDLTAQLVSTDSRLLAIQMYSDFDPMFNNFVLQSKKLVSDAAGFSAQRKRGYLVKGEGAGENQTYNTSRLDSISYYLDYPKNSLIQGGVVFPTKGTISSNESMMAAMRRFLKETKHSVNSQISSLDSAFRLAGIGHKQLSAEVRPLIPEPMNEQLADEMPHNGFKYYSTLAVTPDVLKSRKDLMQYVLILNSMEFRQLNDIFSMMIGQNLQMDQSSFRKKLLKNYLNIPKNQLDKKLSSGTIKEMSLAGYMKMVTGLPVGEAMLSKYKVADLKSRSRMPNAEFEAYIKYLISVSETIKTATQVGQQFVSNGKTYYYITEANFKQPASTQTAKL